MMIKTNIRLFAFAFLIVILWCLSCDNSTELKINETKTKPQFILRSSYKELSVKQVQSIPHITLREKKIWGFWGHSTIENNYELKIINKGKVVIDKATGLVWHQSGSTDHIKLSNTMKWIKYLNQQGYAGFSDWRLPTIEEASSLLEPDKVKDRYIDPVFDGKQEWIWSGDGFDSANAWSADFVGGGVLTCHVEDGSYVRPVRFGK